MNRWTHRADPSSRSWQTSALCRRGDPEVFFHPDLERGAARRQRDAAALAICAECPVLRACRQEALSRREVYGVWGGLTEDQREELWRAPATGRRSPA